MIKLTRERTARAIPPGFRGKKRIEKKLLLLEARRAGTLKFTSKNSYWKQAKKQLKAESHGKCAYCEAPIDTVAHGDVEHFRPKSIYWWLAYCYDNYLFACQICNQTYKGNHFPVFGQRMTIDPPLLDPLPADLEEAELLALAARLAPDPLADDEGYSMALFCQAAAREQAALIDPYTVDPEPFFRWVADPVLKEVYLRPANDQIATMRACEAVEKYLGLNRPELLRVRWQAYELLETLKCVLGSARIPAALRSKVKSQVREMMADSAPFAGMMRYFVNVEWQLDVS